MRGQRIDRARTYGSLVANVGTSSHLAVGNLDSGYYCYSFGLHPEEHQPSGTCNFSRIDNAKLSTTWALGNTTTSVSRDLHIFAHGYNVLRITSGMGGMAYSN